MRQVALTGLCKIELPSHTIRLCDGGRVVWGAETYHARDSAYGLIGAMGVPGEGEGESLQPLDLTLLPPSTTAAADLVQPAFQGSRVRFWLADYVVATGAVSGTPELRFDGELDQATLTTGLELELTIVSQAARLFELNMGNPMSPARHKTIWPGETGHDNATGLTSAVAWGVTAPPAAVSTSANPAMAASIAAGGYAGLPGVAYV